ncbi:hypothetical protein ACROYT_G023964 [Oculina patagonica]
MSTNSDVETLSDKNSTGENVIGEDEHFKSNYTNQMEQSSTSRETEMKTEESVASYTEQKTEEVSCENGTGDSHFESRPPSLSFNSDSTVNSYVTEEGRLEANSPALASDKPDTVPVAESTDGQRNGLLATEENPFLQSVKYLEKHQILRLFQNFAAQIVYKKPDNPLQYLVDELERSREEEVQPETRDST